MKSFSIGHACPDDQRRYREAGGGLFIATVIIIGAAWGSSRLLSMDEPQVRIAFDNLWNAGWFIPAGIVFLVLCFLPFMKSLRYNLNTACNLISYIYICFILFWLVHGTKNLGSSIFGCLLVSLFGISIIVPKEMAIKIMMFLITLLFCVLSIWRDSGMSWKHDSVLLFLSFIAYSYSILIKFFIDTMKTPPAANQESDNS